MIRKTILSVTLAFVLSGAATAQVNESSNTEFARGLRLYESGMYGAARNIFESIADVDSRAEGYAVLCAVKTRSDGSSALVRDYDSKHPGSAMSGVLHYHEGLNLFDDGLYEDAYREFCMVRRKSLSKDDLPEFIYKKGYCLFDAGKLSQAGDVLVEFDSMADNDFSAPAKYALGYIAYSEGQFGKAIDYFEAASVDPRLAEVSTYYVLDCRFQLKDYDYVIAQGPALLENAPEERRAHICRALSESYLVLGQPEKAKEYYQVAAPPVEDMTRSDYFYAGFMYFATEDYQAAIDNYTMMTQRTDSLGQIANYQMGFSYICVRNKVAAMQSFYDASLVSFDSQIEEDAYYNYAKLAFDLNHDSDAFGAYLQRYPDKKKSDSVYSYIALANLYNHDYAGAVAAYDKIDELTNDMSGNYMRANFLRAAQLVENQSWKAAIPCLKASTFFSSKSDPFYRLARYWLAECYFNTERYGDAQRIYNELYNVSALDWLAEGKLITYNEAYCFFKQSDYSSASLWFERYISSRDTRARKDALEKRADCAFVLQKYPEAISFYQMELDEYKDVNDIYPYYRLGMAHGLTGDQQKKMETLEPVLGKNVSPASDYYSEALYELGRSYVALKKEAQAKACFTTLRDSSNDPEYVDRSLIELGMIARNHRNYDEALSYYEEVVRKHRTESAYQDALLAIESIYQAKGQPKKYLEYLEATGNADTKTEAEKAVLYYNSAEQTFLAGNYEKAIPALESFIADYPEHENKSQAIFFLAESYRATGAKEKACEMYGKVLRVEDSGSFAEIAMLNYAELSYSLERYENAYRGYGQLLDAAQIENNKFTARLGMMRSAYRAHDWNNAIAAAEALKFDTRTDSDLVREADYIRAKSYLASSNRAKAFEVFAELARQGSTAEGAEANYLMIQDTYDKGEFSKVENLVYDFAEKSGSQNYWLAKCFIVLGDSFVERDNLAQARQTFQSVLDGYKPSVGNTDDVVEAVKARVEKLKEIAE